MRPASFVLIASCLLPATAPATPSLSSASALASAADAAAAEFMAKQHVPGLAIAVIEHGAVVYEHGYGYADVERRVPVTVDTRFEIGSVTKQFTAACIVQQVRAGKLSLDDTLGKFVTEYPAGANVTVRQMLSHTSGIPEYAFYGQTNPTTLPAILDRIAKKPLAFPPGSQWSYSNTNYVLLGRILELTAHEPYEQYVREHIFAPARMSQSGFLAEERTLPNMATGYEKPGAIAATAVSRDAAGADGSIVSTVGDLAKWNRALTSGAIVSPADVELMQTQITLNDGSAVKYGFGFAVDTFGGHPRISHEGGTDGFSATSALYPRDDEGIVVLENLALGSPYRVASAIFIATHPDVTAKFNTAAPGEDKAVTARLREVLRRAALDKPDRTQFSERFMRAMVAPDGGSSAFIKSELIPLGPATRFVFRGKRRRAADPSTSVPAMTGYSYNVAFGSDLVSMVLGIDTAGKITAFGFARYTDSEVPAKAVPAAKEDPAVTARLRDWLSRIATGEIDRSQLSASFSSFYTPASAAQDRVAFGALGPPKTIAFRRQTIRNGVTVHFYEVTFAAARMGVDIELDQEGKIDSFGYGRLGQPRAR
jgi:CubicO group peptidase (beta-lactamase class C family)